jgi:hypothetical protein
MSNGILDYVNLKIYYSTLVSLYQHLAEKKGAFFYRSRSLKSCSRFAQ